MNIRIINIVLSVSFIFAAHGAGAETYRVNSAEEIRALRPAAGDEIVLSAGIWNDQSITLIGEGTAAAPIVLRAETPGQTILTGSSTLSFSGSHIIVKGLHFRDIALQGGAVISFRTSSTRFAENCTLTECAITGKGLREDATDYKWVSVYGRDNEVSKCTFADKKNMGTLLVVWLTDGQEARHIIKDNYFSRPASMTDGDGRKLNGQETVRIGTSQVSMTDARCLVTGNFFYRCNGEIETVSNKSCGNVYAGNTFSECAGTLTLRHGNDCTVYGNAFFGNGAEQTGGIRIIGERHKVFNNYMQDLTGSGYSAAICLVQGEAEPKLSGYFAAKDCMVVNNTVVNCYWGINVNHGSSRQTEPVENITIADNVIFVESVEKATNIIVRLTPQEPRGIVWRNNFSFGGRLREVTAGEADASEINPSLRRYKGFYVPMRRSPLERYAGKGYEFVTTDFFGNLRDMEKSMPGAFNITASIDADTPSASNRGVTWKLKY